MFNSIDRFPGYLIGSDGSVWSCRSNNGSLHSKWKRLKPNNEKNRLNSCARYSLASSDHKLVRVIASRLVLMAFVGEPPLEKPHAAHWDGDPKNNRLENLRWASAKENEEDKKRHGTHQTGSNNPSAKIDEAVVLRARLLHCQGAGPTSISRKIGLSLTQVKRILNRESWRHV